RRRAVADPRAADAALDVRRERFHDEGVERRRPSAAVQARPRHRESRARALHARQPRVLSAKKRPRFEPRPSFASRGDAYFFFLCASARSIVKPPKLTPMSTPSPAPASASETVPFVSTCAVPDLTAPMLASPCA